MNVNIMALLSSKVPTKNGKVKLFDEEFALMLDDKLTQMELLLPEQAAQSLSQGISPELSQGISPELSQGISLDPQSFLPLAFKPKTNNQTLAEIRISNSPDEKLPQWQLQQIVTHQAGKTAESLRLAKARLSREEIVGDKAAPMFFTEEFKLKPAQRENIPLQAQGEDAQNVSTVMASLTVHQEGAPHATCNPSVHHVVVEPSIARSVNQSPPQQVVNVRYPLGTPEWTQSVSQHITLFSRDNLHNAEIRLHPQELGSLRISLRVQQNQAQIHIVSEHTQVWQMIETAIPHLRAALAESGLQLEQTYVSTDRPHTDGGGHGHQSSGEQHAAHDGEDAFIKEDNVSTLFTPMQVNLYGINTFA